jgi:secreted PhoX family phosphatase
VHLVLTKDAKREQADAANPRTPNRHGHVIELIEEGDDAAATSFRWSHFLLCGPPGSGASYQGVDPEAVNPVSCPDNIAFDGAGNLWIATDGQPKAQDTNDALYAVATEGPERGLTRRFLTAPADSEVCGPEFTPDGRTLFVNVQHPGEDRGVGREDSSHWPDGGDAPPRPSVLAVRRADGGVIGT